MNTTSSNADVAVVIPALNEATVIGEVISGLRAHFPLVILVDDGSTDGTSAIARSVGARVVRHGVNLGRGRPCAPGWPQRSTSRRSSGWSQSMLTASTSPATPLPS